MLGQVVFIVWRESIEALLVVGILFAWLRQNPGMQSGKRFLWLGIAFGLMLATALGVALLGFSEMFEGDRQDYFQMAMMGIATVLIVQMVFWMRRHGRTLKRELEQGLTLQASTANWWGMTLLVAIAIAREGSETVVFLYGMGFAQSQSQWSGFILAALSGLGLAFVSFYLLQLGGKYFSWRIFFRVTEVMLLLLAFGLLVNTVERLIGLGILPTLADSVWDTSQILDESTTMGSLAASLAGYRSHPALSLILVMLGYWGAIWWGLKAPRQPSRLPG